MVVSAVVLVFLLSFPFGLSPMISHDFTRDLLRARDCLESSSCVLETPSTWGEAVHGPIWIRLLIATRWLGMSPSAQNLTIQILVALGMALIHRMTRRYAGRLVAASACAVVLVWYLMIVLYDLEERSLILLPTAIFFYTLFHLASDDGRPWFACSVAAGLALYGCVEIHVGAFICLPLLICVGMMSSRRPVASLVTMLTSFALPAFLFSASAFGRNLRPATGLLLPVTGAAMGAVLLAALARPWWDGLVASRRVGVIVAVSIGAVLTAGPMLAWALGRVFYFAYCLDVAPAIALAAAFALNALRARLPNSRIPAAAVVACWIPLGFLVVFHWAATGGAVGICAEPVYADADRVGRRLREMGWSFDRDKDATRGGPNLKHLLTAMAVFQAKAPSPGEISDHRASPGTMRLLIWPRRIVPSDLPPGWEPIPLSRGWVALASPFRGWIRPRPVAVLAEGRPATIQARHSGELEGMARLSSLFYWDSYEIVGAPAGAPPPQVVTQIYDVQVDEADSREHFVDVVEAPHCDSGPSGGWVIDSIDGVSNSISDDHKHARLSADGVRHGVVSFSRGSSSHSGARGTPLQYIETTEDEKVIREALSRAAF